ncbi:hypothetical protein KCP73_21145 [Salmonella enterica subsp. enterica]|nr:hypothetical protein KCP73_21145 [Salmonella enterica subsp. enterica]
MRAASCVFQFVDVDMLLITTSSAAFRYALALARDIFGHYKRSAAGVADEIGCFRAASILSFF